MERARARSTEEQRHAQRHINELKAEQAKRDEITSESWKQSRLELADCATNLARVLDADEEVLEEFNAYHRRIHQIGETDPSLRASVLTPAEQAREEFLREPREDLDEKIYQISGDLGLLVGARKCDQEGLPIPEDTEENLHGARECVSEIKTWQRERRRKIEHQRTRVRTREQATRPPRERSAARPTPAARASNRRIGSLTCNATRRV